ncbi:MAG: AraC family transcriptional regulator [Lachnospiraceae bacterium]|nr:AraC family transcriptional regulator [Lachnospiraceae bacterium]
MRNELRTDFLTRQYMLSKDYELYYYSDLHAKSGETHTHDYYEFYFFIGGDVTMSIGNKHFNLTPGELVLIPPGVPHYAIINDENKYYQRFVFWISKEYCNQLIKTSQNYGYIMQAATINKHYIFHFDTFQFNAIQAKIFGLIQEMQQDRFGKNAKLRLCVCDLILDLNRMAYEYEHPRKSSKDTSLYEKLVTYIDSHITDHDLSLESIAGNFYLNKYHISHAFKDSLGISLHQYIIKQRLDLFKDYACNNDNLAEVAITCGFSDYSNFYKAFKKEYGISPTEYKKELDIAGAKFQKRSLG